MEEECLDKSKRSKIEQTVLGILDNSDMETTTEYSIRAAAKERLGFALSDLADKKLVRELVDSFLLSTATAIINSLPKDQDNDKNEQSKAEKVTEEIIAQMEQKRSQEQQLNGRGVELHENINERVISKELKGPQEQQLSSGGFELHERNNERIICKLSNKKRVAVHEFKGTKVVSIRDFYEKDGKLFPNRGISLTSKQWSTFRNSFPSIEEAIQMMESRIRLVFLCSKSSHCLTCQFLSSSWIPAKKCRPGVFNLKSIHDRWSWIFRGIAFPNRCEAVAKQSELDTTGSFADRAPQGLAVEKIQNEAGISNSACLKLFSFSSICAGSRKP
ncbi:RNA polymerase II transcriptional coactivator KELP [Olea europaea subsp. europaea]|uniref:RNA polymerase II transcriptional coactivator KELP n=1 Tax=Olea europaea subsp. europaea TaxID=158383 RepID=A0A8S0TSR7_OLEEU|nr:RNA polymerase II transcriptional coactivator KELP [Olea europaea subsp. europaea]